MTSSRFDRKHESSPPLGQLQECKRKLSIFSLGDVYSYVGNFDSWGGSCWRTALWKKSPWLWIAIVPSTCFTYRLLPVASVYLNGWMTVNPISCFTLMIVLGFWKLYLRESCIMPSWKPSNSYLLLLQKKKKITCICSCYFSRLSAWSDFWRLERPEGIVWTVSIREIESHSLTALCSDDR